MARSRVKTRAGVLVDWLESLDPELVQTSPELQQKLLFSRCLLKLSGSGGGSAGRRERSCQPYLLTMLTHQASWASLRKTVDCVLKSYNPSFDAAAVLDFLSACVDVPKLWHGRAKHQPKHETQQVRKDWILLLVDQDHPDVLDPIYEGKLFVVIARADRKSQVWKCLGFCSADSWANKDKKSAVQKPKHCLT